jgi:hypothetical protein
MMKSAAAMLLVILTTPVLASAADIASMSVDDIKTCVEKAGPQRSSIQSALMKTVKRGTVSESEVKFYWKKFDDGLSRAVLRFFAPPDLRGSALLVIEKAGDAESDVFMYVPEFRSVRRITTGMMSGSMFGTDFSYEEFERLYGLAQELETKRLADAEVEGRPSFVIESTPRNDDDSAYARIVQYVEQARCVPIRTEFFATSAEPVKVLSIDPGKLRQIGEAWLPALVEMKDVEEGSQTTLVMGKTEVDVDIPERVFSERSLSRSR